MTIVEVARSYLDGLVSHDADSVLLAPEARRIDNGKVTVEGADALRAVIRREPVGEMGSFRWVVDGDQAIAFYDLDADLARKGDDHGPREKWIPACIGERFLVRDGRIHEIEVVYAAGAADRPRPERPSRYPTGTGSREQVLTVSKAYLASLVSHDASAVPLAPAVWRIENGTNTGDDAASLRKSLESDIMQTVQGMDDERWFAGGDGAAVFYTLRARVGDSDMFMRIAERFRVVDGRLVEIEAVFAPKRD